MPTGQPKSPSIRTPAREDVPDHDDIAASDAAASGSKDQQTPSGAFKRNKKNTYGGPRFLLVPGYEAGTDYVMPSPRSQAFGPGDDNFLASGTRDESNDEHLKDGESLEWQAETPSRRVGYEDMTAIDWIFEYSKERQRLQVLRHNARGIFGYIREVLDSSQVWVVLLLTGVAAGCLAAVIDVASDWLGDIKLGYCASGEDGGHFYLNKYFCCLGFDGLSQCRDWISWKTTLGVTTGNASWLTAYFIFTISSILCAVTASFLVQEYALYAKHSGIPEIKTVLGGFVIRRFMGLWTLVVKSLGLCFAVASGMWLGKEGPLVHVACCCANTFMKLYGNINDNEARKREILSAAAAAGISAAFGSPIGGVLFSLEQLSYYFPDKTMWQSFVCAMAAAVALQAFDPLRSGKIVLYQVTYSSGWHGFELIPFALLGIFGGIYGGLFIRLNMKIAEIKKVATWLPSPIAQVSIVALLTALVNFPNAYMRLQSSELLYYLFAECSKVAHDPFDLCKIGSATGGTVFLLIIAALLGFLLASITFGLQIPAGIILPSMAIGALFGRAVGILMGIWVNTHPGYILFSTCEPDIACVTPGTYAVIGAAAALGGVTRMTVSIVVIMFELTGALSYVLPIMIAVMLSKWVGDAFGKRGIYESWIHFNDYPLLDNSEETYVPDIPVREIMTRIEYLVVLTATGHTIDSLSNILATYPYRGFPVISNAKNAILLGYVSRTELAFNLQTSRQKPRFLPPDTEVFFSHQPQADPQTTLDLRPWMDQTPLTISSQSSLQLTVTYFQKLGLRYVLFCDKGQLQGLLTKKDAWLVLNGAEECLNTVQDHRLKATARSPRDGQAIEERSLLSYDTHSPLIPLSPESSAF
ncbi:Bgt-2546 [Blumeria graminis f. sp. tritici]|uniref:Chloride channel protein n=2 Tax=Blumeria graminis f. sp. tritici TaxID=62690 RepID=A0A061HGH4_BLUGR|nr:Chloride channel [Blumeria graminis f. sp. tritici 96224]VDB93462.1 Bgt-2546 [Blumeria graminis f. sp. tritici]